MNGVILELSAVEDKIIDNKEMYSFEIHKRMSEILKIDKREELRVSNIFGEFFNESIKLEKGEKYIAPLYNYLIKENYKVRISIIPFENVHVIGTPEELEEFKNSDYNI